MARPDSGRRDRRPAVYARLSAQIDHADDVRPVKLWVRWLGWILAVAMVVVAIVAVTAGQAT